VGPEKALACLSDRRGRLLRLFYEEKISADGFKEAEDRLIAEMESQRTKAREEAERNEAATDLLRRFEEVVRMLEKLDIRTLWFAADRSEQRKLVQEMIQSIAVFPDHLEFPCWEHRQSMSV
jgi:hypothetical protein